MKSRYLYSLVAIMPDGDRITRHELPANSEEQAIEMALEDYPDALEIEILSETENVREDD